MSNEEIKETLEENETDVINNDNVSEETEAKESEVTELNNRLLRLKADFINFRKRTEKEKESSFSNGMEFFVCELLPILDNFQRALESEKNKEDSFYKGVKMIEMQIIELLKNNSIEEIEAMGELFDPNYHHAVVVEESDDYVSGVVMDVLQKGYKLKDKVIRPVMVKVSK